MSIQILVIYKFTPLFQILEELNLDLNFKIIFADKEKFLKDKVKNLNNYLIISDKKYADIGDQFVLNNIPCLLYTSPSPRDS